MKRRRAVAGKATLGFTYVEVMVSVGIIAILALAGLQIFEWDNRRQKEQALRTALREIRHALDAYRTAALDGKIRIADGESGYPPSLTVLVSGVLDVSHPSQRRLYFLRRIPHDPFKPKDASESEGWGIRSYRSAPDRPQPGKDVYDIYSLSPGRAQDGSYYRDW